MAKVDRTRRNLLIGSGSAALLSLIPLPAFAQSPTAVCSKVGQKIIFKGKHYLCVKSGGKLGWSLLTPAKPPITIHPSPLPTSTPSKVSGYLVAKISELIEGQSKIVTAKDLSGATQPIALFLTGGVVTAHSTICTHMGCQVAAAGKQLDCPCHGSVYSAQTGAVINGPAPAPLAAYKVAQVGNDIYIVGSN